MGRTGVLTRSWMAGWGAVSLLVAGCNLTPPVSLPQLEGVQRAVSEPREERSRTYQRCLQGALSEPASDHEGDQEELLACMKEAGFGFLAKSADHRRAHCLTALETAEAFPEAYCFQKVE